jgi:hypothetical protein
MKRTGGEKNTGNILHDISSPGFDSPVGYNKINKARAKRPGLGAQRNKEKKKR